MPDDGPAARRARVAVAVIGARPVGGYSGKTTLVVGASGGEPATVSACCAPVAVARSGCCG